MYSIKEYIFTLIWQKKLKQSHVSENLIIIVNSFCTRQFYNFYVNEAKPLRLTSYQYGANGQCKKVDTLLYRGKVLGFLFYSIEGGA